MSIKNKFDSISQKYDEQRKLFIPCFDDYYSVPFTTLDCSLHAPRVLDIGAGTGLCSAMLLKRYPHAQLTLIDLSERMLEVAQKRFAEKQDTVYIAGDYTACRHPKPFDIIISALSIHL